MFFFFVYFLKQEWHKCKTLDFGKSVCKPELKKKNPAKETDSKLKWEYT